MEELILWGTWALRLIVFKFMLEIISTLASLWVKHQGFNQFHSMIMEKIKEAEVEKL